MKYERITNFVMINDFKLLSIYDLSLISNYWIMYLNMTYTYNNIYSKYTSAEMNTFLAYVESVKDNMYCKTL